MGKLLLVVACVGLATCGAVAQEPPTAIRIRLSHPDRQLGEVIKLFEGSKSPNPAASLAAWKRASAEPNRLGKPIEALIAAINPAMVGELKTLEGAEVSIWFDGPTGEPTWAASLPNDDGTFAALSTALVLSGGASEAPLGDLAVDRLEGPGSVLMATVGGKTLLARNREGLRIARQLLAAPREGLVALSDGFHVQIEPGALRGSKSLVVKRFEESIRPANQNQDAPNGPLHFNARVEHNSLVCDVTDADSSFLSKTAIDPAWLDWIPEDRAIVGFALSTDPAAKSWDELFGLADRVEKLDPARADVASVRIRLELLARLSGVRAEADVLRHLKGVSGWAGSNGKAMDSALIVLHLDEPAVAERIVNNVKPLPGTSTVPAPEVGRPRSLGLLDRRTLRISRIDQAVVLTWGEGVPSSVFDGSRSSSS